MSIEKDFRILEEYVLPPKAPLQTDQYYKYTKPSLEQLDARLEYDMDEEDFAWLELVNEQRKISGSDDISYEVFEGLMDRFEKECFFHCTSKNFKPLPPELEHQADCAVCLEGWSNEDNAILFCDMCCLSVHQGCYGVLRVPDDIWLCRRCLNSPAAPASCCLCPCKSGALKQSLDDQWCHVTCAFFTPGVTFGDLIAREPILGLDSVMGRGLTCSVCGVQNKGSCLTCQHPGCSEAYHATCAQLMKGIGLKTEYRSEIDGTISKIVSTYCETHCKSSFTSSSLSAPPSITNSDDPVPPSEIVDESPGRQLPWKARLKQVRRVLSMWMEMEQPSFVPVLTLSSVKKITKMADEMGVVKSEAVVNKLHSYWTLKRQSRNGRPLINSRKYGEGIQILDINKHLKVVSKEPTKESKDDTEQKVETKDKKQQVEKKDNENKESEPVKIEKNILEGKRKRKNTEEAEEEKDKEEIPQEENQMDYGRQGQVLRRELEKVRLLIELVRKREKTKMEMLKVKQRLFEVQSGADVKAPFCSTSSVGFSQFNNKSKRGRKKNTETKVKRQTRKKDDDCSDDDDTPYKTPTPVLDDSFRVYREETDHDVMKPPSELPLSDSEFEQMMEDDDDEDGGEDTDDKKLEGPCVVWVLATSPIPALLLDSKTPTRTLRFTPSQELKDKLSKKPHLRAVVLLGRHYSLKCVCLRKLAKMGDEEEDEKRMSGVSDQTTKRNIRAAYQRAMLLKKYLAENKDGRYETDDVTERPAPDVQQLLDLFDKQKIASTPEHNND